MLMSMEKDILMSLDNNLVIARDVEKANSLTPNIV